MKWTHVRLYPCSTFDFLIWSLTGIYLSSFLSSCSKLYFTINVRNRNFVWCSCVSCLWCVQQIVWSVWCHEEGASYSCSLLIAGRWERHEVWLLKARCHGDSLRAASASGKWSWRVATAALSTYSLTRIAPPQVDDRATLLSCYRSHDLQAGM